MLDDTHIENSKKIEYLKEAEEVAFKNPEIVNTNGSSFSESKTEVILGNSKGFKNGYKTSNFTAYCEVVSKATGIWKEIMSILLKDILKIYLNQ